MVAPGLITIKITAVSRYKNGEDLVIKTKIRQEKKIIRYIQTN